MPVLVIVMEPFIAIIMLFCCIQIFRLCSTAPLLIFFTSASCGFLLIPILGIVIRRLINCTRKSY